MYIWMAMDEEEPSMSTRVSIAEARDNMVSSDDDQRLTTSKSDLWEAIQKFRSEHDLEELHAEEVFADVRDRAPGREVEC